MALLKQIKFGNSATPIAQTQVAINSDSNKVLSVVGTNTDVDVEANPLYTIALAVDGKTITKTGDTGLATALALKVEAASGEGQDAKKARIALVDSNGGEGYAELSSVNIEDIVGGSIVKSAAYDPATGILTITWAGSGSSKTTEIDLGKLLDIDDIIIKSDSTGYLSFAAVDPGTETGGQAQIGVKLADVTYTASVPGTSEANLTVDTTNGKMLAADDAIPAIKSYVDAKTTDLAVKAQGDAYVAASVDANDNKKVIVATNKQDLTATAGTPGVYAADGSQTTAPVAGTLSGTANSLADGADIATKVKTYVDGAIAIEAARSDAKNKADASTAPLNGYVKGTDELPLAATDTINQAFSKIEVSIEKNENVTAAALNDINTKINGMDKAASAADGQVVTTVSEADGVVSETKANVKDLQLGGYAKDATATGAIAGADTINTAFSKLENAIASATAGHSKVAKDANANHLTVTASQPDASGAITYTIGESDIASATDLTTEVNRAKSAETAIDGAVGLTKDANGEGRTYTNTGEYIGKGQTNTVASDIKALDTQLKTVTDKVDGIQYSISGTTLEFFGISEQTNA